MHIIVNNTRLSPNVTALTVTAERVAAVRKPGQFVIVRKGPGAERIPLTIAHADPFDGTITLVIQAVGKSTRELTALLPGEAIQDIAGPLGFPTELIESGHPCFWTAEGFPGYPLIGQTRGLVTSNRG